ncbi:MAG: PLD nuclease N-terminal domain-containing protein [Defluviitaleaceae bacterium]|nr:PLD nuclease N-terminal domain-containing protein [Defluviitaleaceae bacterium]
MDYLAEIWTEIWEVHRIFLLAIIPVIALDLILMSVSLVNLVRKPVSASAKIGWVLAIVLVNTIGPIIYLAFGSKQLDEKAITWDDPKEYGNFD